MDPIRTFNYHVYASSASGGSGGKDPLKKSIIDCADRNWELEQKIENFILSGKTPDSICIYDDLASSYKWAIKKVAAKIPTTSDLTFLCSHKQDAHFLSTIPADIIKVIFQLKYADYLNFLDFGNFSMRWTASTPIHYWKSSSYKQLPATGGSGGKDPLDKLIKANKLLKDHSKTAKNKWDYEHLQIDTRISHALHNWKPKANRNWELEQKIENFILSGKNPDSILYIYDDLENSYKQAIKKVAAKVPTASDLAFLCGHKQDAHFLSTIPFDIIKVIFQLKYANYLCYDTFRQHWQSIALKSLSLNFKIENIKLALESTVEKIDEEKPKENNERCTIA